MHNSIPKLKKVCGIVYFLLNEELEQQVTFVEKRGVQLKKTLWVSRNLDKVKASAKSSRIIIKVQLLRAKDFTLFSGPTPSDGNTVIVPHTATFIVARGLHLEQDGFSYIDLAETI